MQAAELALFTLKTHEHSNTVREKTKVKLRLNKLRERLRQNRGHLVVESTFVYPLMFFVLFFLMFLGNMFYLRARIDSMVTQEAIRYAAEYANPNLAAFEEEIPTTVEGKELTKDLYRYINIFSKEENLDTELSDRIGETSGYFTGMNPDNIVIKEYRAKNYVIYQSYVVEVTYELKTPIKFLFDDDYLTLDMTARAEVPVTDTAEFIRNVDMAVDLVERTEAGTKLTEKINDTYAKVEEFLNGEGGVSGDNGAVAGGATGGTTDLESLTVEERQTLADKAAQDYNAKYNSYAKAVAKGYVGVEKTPNGGPSFANTEYVYQENGHKCIVTIEATGSRKQDFKQANEYIKKHYGIDKPDDYTWHHLDNYDVATNTITMELVLTEVHKATVPHSGGCAQYKAATGKAYKS